MYLRADFTDQLDRVIADNTRMLLKALTQPDTVPWVTEADLRDVFDAKEEVLRQWMSAWRRSSRNMNPIRSAFAPCEPRWKNACCGPSQA